MATIAEVQKQCRAKDFDWRSVKVTPREFDPPAMLAWAGKLGLQFYVMGDGLCLDLTGKKRGVGRKGQNEELAFFAALNHGRHSKARRAALVAHLRSHAIKVAEAA